MSPKPVTTLMTPGGKPTSRERAARARAVRGVYRFLLKVTNSDKDTVKIKRIPVQLA